MGHKTVLYVLLCCVFVCFVGCSNDILDPTQIGRFRPTPVVNVILESLGVVDEPQDMFANAEDPLPEDVIPVDKDYVFGSGDIIRIGIYELREESRSFLDDYIVTETGNISIPDLGVIKVGGLTENELEEKIVDLLSPDILISPSVKVMLFRSESLVFSISGEGVYRDSRYNIPRYDFRLLDAIALAAGIQQLNVSNIYVTRQITFDDPLDFGGEVQGGDVYERTEDGKFEDMLDGSGGESLPEDSLFEVITPSFSKEYTGQSGIVITSAEMITDEELELLAAPAGIEREPRVNRIPEYEEESYFQDGGSNEIEWVFEDGRYVPVSTGRSTQKHKEKIKTVSRRPERTSFGWDEIGSGGTQSRVIKIPVDKLYGGDGQYNVIIRAGDVITVPNDIVGYFYVIGNTNYEGEISLTGKPMTLMQAIASARGLDDLAWPEKVEVIRRIGRNKQVTVLVNLDKIAKGTQPDFFIKPNDTINVGTHGVARYLAAFRNGIYMRSGMEMYYSRNFAHHDSGQNLDLISHVRDLF